MGDQHLVIKYITDTKSYYIKDTGEGTGTFIQIDNSITLQNEYIISFGTFHMFIIITGDNELRLKFLDGPNTESLLYSSPHTLVRLSRVIVQYV